MVASIVSRPQFAFGRKINSRLADSTHVPFPVGNRRVVAARRWSGAAMTNRPDAEGEFILKSVGWRLARGEGRSIAAALFSVLLASCTSTGDPTMSVVSPAYN